MSNPIANRALAALLMDRVVEVKQARGPFAPARVVASSKGTDYTFQLLGDGKWRLTLVSTYSNASMVTGEGCDASGWVVNGEWSKVLDSRLNR